MRVAIVSAVRTPIGNFGGSLRTVPAYDLAAIVLNERPGGPTSSPSPSILLSWDRTIKAAST